MQLWMLIVCFQYCFRWQKLALKKLNKLFKSTWNSIFSHSSTTILKVEASQISTKKIKMPDVVLVKRVTQTVGSIRKTKNVLNNAVLIRITSNSPNSKIMVSSKTNNFTMAEWVVRTKIRRMSRVGLITINSIISIKISPDHNTVITKMT